MPDDTPVTPAVPAPVVEYHAPTLAELRAAYDETMAGFKADVEFFYDEDKTPWARVLVGGQTGHYEHLPVMSQDFRWLVEKYAHDHLENGIPKPAWVGQTIDRYAAIAKYGEGGTPAQQHTMRLRVAGDPTDAIYIDLGNADWQVVKITAAGWSVVSNTEVPVRFWRPARMQALPLPQNVADWGIGFEISGEYKTPEQFILESLKLFVNVKPEDRILVMAWLVAALRPTGPYMVLAFHGEMDSAKTTSQKFLKSLVDPDNAEHAMPKSEHGLFSTARQHYVPWFGNMSDLKDEMSDALCRLATEGILEMRKFHTECDTKTIRATRPVLLNGIVEVATRADLKRRLLLIDCPRLAKKTPLRTLDDAAAQLRPSILGALCSVVAKTMAAIPQTDYTLTDSSQDFVQWGCAAEGPLGFKSGDFLKAWRANQQELKDQTLEIPVIQQLLTLRSQGLANRDWSGTKTDLLEWLVPTRKAGMPATPEALHRELRRAEEALRSRGIFFAKLTRGTGGIRRWRIWDEEGARLKAEADQRETERMAEKEQQETERILAMQAETRRIEEAGGRRTLIKAYRENHPELVDVPNDMVFELAKRELTTARLFTTPKTTVTTVTTVPTPQGRPAICDAYRKAHPAKCKGLTNGQVYKLAMAQTKA